MPPLFTKASTPTTTGFRPGALATSAALVLGGSLVLALSARVSVPFWPVPMTMQTLAVLLLGVLLGPRLAAGAVLAYWAEGAAGLPVFSHGAVLFGPTTGYILGFLPAAILSGLAAERSRSAVAAAVLLCVADAVMLALGVAWLSTLIGVERAMAAGLTPFLLGEALKVCLAVAVLRAVPRRG